jgi:hypothetical protein
MGVIWWHEEKEMAMTSRSRSLSGALLMLILIPVFAGLLACMPVPIGDPERSRINADMTGIWVILEGESSDVEAGFFIFEPYDKRTMLITMITLAEGDELDLADYDFTSYAGYESLAATQEVNSDQVYADEVGLYKAWLTKLAGEWFFTWEPKGMADALGEDPELWIVQQIVEHTDGKMTLRWVNGESEPFDDIKKTRRAYERVLKKNVNNPEIYGAPDDEYKFSLVRAEGPVLEFVEDVAGYVIED